KEKPATATGVFSQISEQIDALSGEILAGVAMLVDAPRMLVWVHNQMSDAAARQLWGEAALAFAIVFGAAALAEWIIRRLLNRALPRFPVRRSDTRAVRGLFAALGLVLGLLPIVGFAATAYAALSMILEPLSRSRLTLSILVNAAVEARLILCV